MSDVYSYIAEQKKRLDKMVTERTIEEPALFWAGLMSNWVRDSCRGSVLNLSYSLQVLKAVSDEYDRVIMDKVNNIV